MTVTCDSALMTSGNTACDQNLKKHSLSSAVDGGKGKRGEPRVVAGACWPAPLLLLLLQLIEREEATC